MSADLSMGFGVTGADEVARHLASVSGQLGRLTERQQQNTQAGRQMARAGQDSTQSFQGLVGQGQALTQRLQGTASAVQTLVSQLGGRDRSAGLVSSVAGNVAQFAAMGSMLGPGGTVVGAIVGLGTALVGLVRQQNDVASATAEASEALRDQADAAAEAREAVTAAANLNAAGARRDLAPTLLADRSGADLTTEANRRRAGIVELERLTSENEILRGRVEGGSLTAANARNLTGGTEAVAALGGARSLADARASLETLEREIERRRELESAEASEAETRTRTEADRRAAAEAGREAEEEWSRTVADRAAYEEAQRQRAIAGAAERAEAMEAAWAREAAAIAEVQARFDELMRVQAEMAGKSAAEAAEADAEAVAEATKDWEDLANKQREVLELQEELRHSSDGLVAAFGNVTGSLEEVADAWREARRAQSAAGQSMLSDGALLERSMVSVGNSIADTVGGTMVGAFEKAMGAWLDGTKTFVEAAEEMVKGVLKALVIESVVQAITETARGIADMASYQYATGAAHFAAAGAWAAVGVAAGAVGAGIGAFGGGGGGGGSQQAPTSRELAGDGGGDKGGDTYEINVFPGGFITQDQVSGGIVDGLNRAARNGRRVDSRLLGR